MARQIQTTDAYRTKTATISSTAKPITHADFGWETGDIETAQIAYITVTLAEINFTWDGTTPTSTVGMLAPANVSYAVIGNVNIRSLQFIRATNVDALLSITLEK